MHNPKPIDFVFDFPIRAHCDYDRKTNVMDIWFMFDTPRGEILCPKEIEDVITDDLDTMNEIERDFRKQIDNYFEE